MRNDLRLRRLRTAVGVVDHIPAVAGHFPLGPERQVIIQHERRTRRIGGSGSVLFGIPFDKLPSWKHRNLIRQLYILSVEGREPDILRPVRGCSGLGIFEIDIVYRNIQRKEHPVWISVILGIFHFVGDYPFRIQGTLRFSLDRIVSRRHIQVHAPVVAGFSGGVRIAVRGHGGVGNADIFQEIMMVAAFDRCRRMPCPVRAFSFSSFRKGVGVIIVPQRFAVMALDDFPIEFQTHYDDV